VYKLKFLRDYIKLLKLSMSLYKAFVFFVVLSCIIFLPSPLSLYKAISHVEKVINRKTSTGGKYTEKIIGKDIVNAMAKAR